MKQILIALVRAVPDAQTILAKIIQNIGKWLQGIDYSLGSETVKSKTLQFNDELL